MFNKIFNNINSLHKKMKICLDEDKVRITLSVLVFGFYNYTMITKEMMLKDEINELKFRLLKKN